MTGRTDTRDGAAYSLECFIADGDRIAREATSHEIITARVAPLLARLVREPAAIPPEFRRRPPSGERGRYVLHRAPHFNVTSAVWGPGDGTPAHSHETWGVIGVIDNEIEETRYRVRLIDGLPRLEPRRCCATAPARSRAWCPRTTRSTRCTTAPIATPSRSR